MPDIIYQMGLHLPPESPNKTESSQRGDEPCESESKTWPESARRPTIGRRIAGVFESWTYSYMLPVLKKGQRQFKDGEHLTPDDLFAVPEHMQAKHLVKEFR